MARSSGGKGLAALVLLSLGGGWAAHAAPTPLLSPFGDFALRDPAEPTHPGAPDYYSASEPDPGWQIGQWNIPGGRLSPFSAAKAGDLDLLTSVAPEAMVRIVRGPQRRALELAQDGAVLPCTDPHGAPRESDLQFGPKDRGAPGANALTKGVVPLAHLGSLVLVTTISVRYGMTAVPKGCIVNQGSAIVAVVLNNLTMRPPQTLFYTLGLNAPCGPGPAARVRVCEGGAKTALFYFQHNPFGVSDWLPLLGQPYFTEGQHRTIALDLLPRLKHLIAASPGEMDHDPSHWVVDNVYADQHIWGDFTLASTWERFQVLAGSN